jgi:hypothetical protein
VRESVDGDGVVIGRRDIFDIGIDILLRSSCGPCVVCAFRWGGILREALLG